jgi:hypothetical protein
LSLSPEGRMAICLGVTFGVFGIFGL